MTTAIAIFVKTPELSPVKTRLAATIGNSAAQHFHRLACAATAEVIDACRPQLCPYWAVAEERALASTNWRGFPRIWQGVGTLGERLHRVHAELHARHGSVLMIGADTPQVTPALLREALAQMRNPAIAYVLGPARDGGFWLFGSKHPIPATLWTGLAYSRNDTAAALRRALLGSGRLETLPLLTDIDTAADLRDLTTALQSACTPAQYALLQWLGQLSVDTSVSCISAMAR